MELMVTGSKGLTQQRGLEELNARFIAYLDATARPYGHSFPTWLKTA